MTQAQLDALLFCLESIKEIVSTLRVLGDHQHTDPAQAARFAEIHRAIKAHLREVQVPE
jgi:hypothetical protein